MAGTGPSDLPGLAQEFLNACEAALDTIPTLAPGYGGAPARVFVSPGLPALDCPDQLTVYVSQVGYGSITGLIPSAPKAKINSVTMIATASRCITTQEGTRLPSPESIQADAVQVDLDKWALWNHTFNLYLAGELFDRCGEVEFVGIVPLTPQGGCAGSQMTVRVSLDGYEESIGT